MEFNAQMWEKVRIFTKTSYQTTDIRKIFIEGNQIMFRLNGIHIFGVLVAFALEDRFRKKIVRSFPAAAVW